MRRIQRRARLVKNELTREQVIELLIGPTGKSAFKSESEARAAWSEHRAELLESSAPFRRPEAWSKFDCPHTPRLWANEPNANFFERNNQITEAEKRLLAALRHSGDIPPMPITSKPTDELLRYFRYSGETEIEFRERFQDAGVDPWEQK
jgi:hypothetical protein